MPTLPGETGQFDPSQALGDIIFFALDHGINSVREGGPLVPFVMTEAGGKRALSRFVDEPYESAVAAAKDFASKLLPQSSMYVLCSDGVVTINDRKYSAIIAVGAERGQGRAYVLAQRYEPPTGSKALQAVGNPAFLGRENSLFEP